MSDKITITVLPDGAITIAIPSSLGKFVSLTDSRRPQPAGRQEPLPLDEEDPIRYNDHGEKLPSKSQEYTLRKAGMWRDDMTRHEAWIIIANMKNIKGNGVEPPPIPVRAATPPATTAPAKRKRGRPRKLDKPDISDVVIPEGTKDSIPF